MTIGQWLLDNFNDARIVVNLADWMGADFEGKPGLARQCSVGMNEAVLYFNRGNNRPAYLVIDDEQGRDWDSELQRTGRMMRHRPASFYKLVQSA